MSASAIPSYIVKLERLYFYEECIEEGQYTRAQRAKFRTGNSVIDVLAKTLIQTEQEYVKNFRDNAKSLITLQHPNIINTIAIAYDPNGPLVAIMEYFPGRTLLNHLHQNNADISWPVRLRIAVECAQALEYLHGNEVVYRQVTANHVILNDDFTCKLADFGLVRIKHADDNTALTRYMAPEVLKRGHFTISSDIWAYGIFLVELFNDGKLPYKDLNNAEVTDKLTDGSLYRMEIPVFIPEQVRVCIKMCWEETPDKRPNIRAVYKGIRALMMPSGR